MALALVYMPLALLYVWTRNPTSYELESFESSWASFYEGIRKVNKYTLMFNFFFMLRRIALVYAIFWFKDYVTFQLMSLFALNLTLLIYQGSTRPLTWKLRNRIELFNEACIAAVAIHLLVFTDWVTDPLAAETMGFAMLGVFLVCLILNLSVVFYFAFLAVRNVCIKYYRIAAAKVAARRNQEENKRNYSLIYSFEAKLEKYKED